MVVRTPVTLLAIQYYPRHDERHAILSIYQPHAQNTLRAKWGIPIRKELLCSGVPTKTLPDGVVISPI